MARKSSKDRNNSVLQKYHGLKTPQLEQEYESLKNSDVLTSKVRKRIEAIEGILKHRNDSRIKILQVAKTA